MNQPPQLSLTAAEDRKQDTHSLLQRPPEIQVANVNLIAVPILPPLRDFLPQDFLCKYVKAGTVLNNEQLLIVSYELYIAYKEALEDAAFLKQQCGNTTEVAKLKQQLLQMQKLQEQATKHNEELTRHNEELTRNNEKLNLLISDLQNENKQLRSKLEEMEVKLYELQRTERQRAEQEEKKRRRNISAEIAMEIERAIIERVFKERNSEFLKIKDILSKLSMTEQNEWEILRLKLNVPGIGNDSTFCNILKEFKGERNSKAHSEYRPKVPIEHLEKIMMQYCEDCGDNVKLWQDRSKKLIAMLKELRGNSPFGTE